MLLALLFGLNLGENIGLDWAFAGFASVVRFVCDAIPLPRLARFYHRRVLALAEKTQHPLALAPHTSSGECTRTMRPVTG